MDVSEHLNALLTGRYEIEREVGAGGMATVYLARDLRHDRKVALKVLRPELAAVLGPERFLSEIKVTANLQHPHLLPLFDSGEAEGLLFYVMPFVEGETLRDRLERERQLPVEEAVRIGAAVASALDYAHRHNVIHRDLKPENILLHEGQPLVTDFGIALAVSVAGGARVTQTGLSLGTPQYMSPEQATGDRQIDARSDIYSLGAVVYEMLTGDPPHTASTVQAVIAKVLTDRPHTIRAQRASVPEHVDAAVMIALAKLPADRFATAGDFAEALTGERPVSVRAAPTPTAEVTEGSRARAWRRFIPHVITGVTAVVAGAFAAWAVGRPAPPRPVRFTVPLPSADMLPETGPTQPGPVLTLSPDGASLVYVATRNDVDQLYRRSLDQLEPVAIPGTGGARFPFFSPDGLWLGFQADGKLKKISLAGGPPAVLCDLPNVFQGASWGSDDRIIFAGGDSSVLWVVPAAGGVPRPLTTLEADEAIQRWPHVLPGGEAVVFASFPIETAAPRVVALSLRTGERRVLLEGTSPRYAATGHLLFSREASLWAAPFDVSRLSVTGDPVPLLEGVNIRGGGNSDFAVAADGTVAYLPGATTSGGRTLVWVDREGREEPIPAPPRAYVYPSISPDGVMLALQVADQDNDIWIWDFARATLTRLTFHPGFDQVPVWAPDGRRVVYASQRETLNLRLYWQAADGTGAVERLTEGVRGQAPESFSPDGRLLAFSEGGTDLMMLTLDGERRAASLVQTPFQERNGQISPDGRWLAYQSQESGRSEIYVRPFPSVESGRWQVSTNGGSRPLWSRDGRELFYVAPGQRLMSVAVRASGSVFAAGTPQPMSVGGPQYLLPVAAALPGRTYDISPDGRRFLLIRESASADGAPPVTQFIVILNWFEELKRLVPGR